MANRTDHCEQLRRPILLFILDYRAKNSMSPTRQEIAEHLNLTAGALGTQLRTMRRQGYLTWSNRTARSIQVQRQWYQPPLTETDPH